jgi:trehalose-phosphatase
VVDDAATLEEPARRVKHTRPGGRALKGISHELWDEAAAAPHRLLMLDYDGTLAPFRLARAEARPLPESLERMAAITRGARTTLAVLSGRPVKELAAFLGALPIRLVGEHGWESRPTAGVTFQFGLDPAIVEILDRAERLARAEGWEGRLERKRTGLVLHTRSLPAEEADRLRGRAREKWVPLVSPGVVRLDATDGGIELRAAGRNKGTGVETLLAEAPPGTLGVFLGDDVTDEDGFLALRERGWGIRVGDPGVPTAARALLPSCEAVADFLGEWVARIEGRLARR